MFDNKTKLYTKYFDQFYYYRLKYNKFEEEESLYGRMDYFTSIYIETYVTLLH